MPTVQRYSGPRGSAQLKDVPCPYAAYWRSCTQAAHKATEGAISGLRLGIVRTAKPWDEIDVQIRILIKLYFLGY